MEEKLKNLKIFLLSKRLLEFEQNISKDKKYARADLGF